MTRKNSFQPLPGYHWGLMGFLVAFQKCVSVLGLVALEMENFYLRRPGFASSSRQIGKCLHLERQSWQKGPETNACALLCRRFSVTGTLFGLKITRLLSKFRSPTVAFQSTSSLGFCLLLHPFAVLVCDFVFLGARNWDTNRWACWGIGCEGTHDIWRVSEGFGLQDIVQLDPLAEWNSGVLCRFFAQHSRRLEIAPIYSGAWSELPHVCDASRSGPKGTGWRYRGCIEVRNQGLDWTYSQQPQNVFWDGIT